MSEVTDYQLHTNGPLKPEVVEQLKMIRAQKNLTYKMIGFQLNISGAFAHNILNKGMSITTNPYMYKIAPGITQLLRGEVMPMDGVDAVDIENEEAVADELVSHSYQLRKGMILSLALPADLTGKEAERLSLFIRSLPH